MKVLQFPCFHRNFYHNVSSYGFVLQTMKFRKKKYLLIIRTQLGSKIFLQKKNKMLLQCSYSCKFPASSIFSSADWRCRYPVVARSRFRWKLHPSSQAWPLLSTSNRGEIAIAKCGKFPTFGIRARAALSCVRAKNAGGYGCYWGAQCRQAPIPSVACVLIINFYQRYQAL